MKLFIRTFGCQMNVHDSDKIVGLLQQRGFEVTSKDKDADVIVVNTCSVREKPRHKAVSEVGRYCARKQRGGRGPVVVVAGCVAEQEKDKWFEQIPGLDLVVGPDHYAELPGLIADVKSDGQKAAATGFDQGLPEDFLFVIPPKGRASATQYVTIMKGCEEKCSYCIVPSVRGPERFRPAGDIVSEVKLLTGAGTKEVMLLGQKVNSYRKGELDFADLLEKLAEIKELKRLRFTSPHPKHMTDRLIGLYGKLACLCESIHLPVQSGSDRTLERMGRKYNGDFYRDIVRALRQACPSIVISTDLIVGYPGETASDFDETIRLIEDVRFCGAFSFKYSPRPGTVAAGLEDDVPPEDKQQRLTMVHEVTARIESEIRSEFVGKTFEVLVEKQGRFKNQFTGRARNNQIINFEMPSGIKLKDMEGTFINVRITRAMPHCLEGALA